MSAYVLADIGLTSANLRDAAALPLHEKSAISSARASQRYNASRRG